MFNNEMITKAFAIVDDANSTKNEVAFAKFIIAKDGKNHNDAVEVAETLNKKFLAEAVSTLWDGNTFKWNELINGVAYPCIDTENKDTEFVKDKFVLVRDCFCMRKTKNSTKAVLDSVILGMVAQFGVNLGFAFADEHKEVVSMLKVYTKFTDAPKCFFGDTCTSNNSLEKQLQVIADTMLGKGAVKIKKMHVTHAKDTFIRATKNGYKNGNELALLQILVNHIADAKNGKVYKHDSKLIAHKEVKDKSDKK